MANQNRQTIDQLKQQQRLLQIFIFSLVTIFIWIGFALLRSQQETQVDAKLLEQAKPLTPTIKSEVIDELEQKRLYTESELRDFPIYKFLLDKDSGINRVVTIDVEPEPEDQALPRSQGALTGSDDSDDSLDGTALSSELETEPQADVQPEGEVQGDGEVVAPPPGALEEEDLLPQFPTETQTDQL